MNRSELRIGDAVEVKRLHWQQRDGSITEEFIPATVCATDPLCVAYSDGSREALSRSAIIRQPLWRGK